jgi:hypothetical protein
MKTAAKVFLIIGMILTFYLIFPVIIGVIAIRKLDNAKSKDDLILWGILSLFFVSRLGGLFMLLVPEDELNTQNAVVYEENSNEERDPADMLLELKKLRDEGVIDEATYQEKRKKYVEQL